MSNDVELNIKDLHKLLDNFGYNSYETGSCELGTLEYEVIKKCEFLLQRDHTLIEIDNTNGTLCPRYPSRIYIPECPKNQRSSVNKNLNIKEVVVEEEEKEELDDDIEVVEQLQQRQQQQQQHYDHNNGDDVVDSNIEAYVSFANPLSVHQQQQHQHQQPQNHVRATPISLLQHHLQQQLIIEGADKQKVKQTTPSLSPPPSLPALLPTSPTASPPAQITNGKSSPYNTDNYYFEDIDDQAVIITTTQTTETVSCDKMCIFEDNFDITKFRDLIMMAKYARCRQRFAIPVIMYRDKYICRSATISVSPETYCRKVVDCAYEYLTGTNPIAITTTTIASVTATAPTTEEQNNDEDSFLSFDLDHQHQQQQQQQLQQFSYEETIKNDILLLNCLNVKTIVDLMVENKKIKYFMAVSSSEKADHEKRYCNFHLLSLPYPGCEFFKSFRYNNYAAENLYYNWNPSFNDAHLTIPNDSLANQLDIKWSTYKNWDLVLMTQNYLKACLKYISDDKNGLLIHCISGWDRTPLFIALIRLSLWADNLIHQSLNGLEITYLTIAYDWYLFGHQLPDRLRRHEDIMFFCFDVLNHLYDEQFSIIEQRERTKTESSSDGSSSSKFSINDQPDKAQNEDIFQDVNFESDQFYWEPFERSFTNQSNNDLTTIDNNTYSPNFKKTKTSPMWVPTIACNSGCGVAIANNERKRNESSSSSSSWQNVDFTGSVNGSVKNNNLMQSDSPPKQATTNNNLLTNNHHINGTMEQSDEITMNRNLLSSPSSKNTCDTNSNENAITTAMNGNNSNLSQVPNTRFTQRFERLCEVRTIFYKAYSHTIGLKPIGST